MGLRRIGVMGGMFDPVHNAHVEAAKIAIQVLDLDVLYMVPCHVPNHRSAANASAEQLLEMLRLATGGIRKVKVDDRECRREGVSYTVDTLVSVANDNPGAMLVLVLGIDAFANLPQWHNWQALFALGSVLVLDRPGPLVQIDPELEMDLQYREVNSVDRFFSVPQGRIWRLSEPKLEISSTQVRESLNANPSAAQQIPAAVADYIKANSLYQNRAQSQD